MKAKEELTDIQHIMHRNLDDVNLATCEKEARTRFKNALENQNSLLQQKSKLSWLRCGDENTQIFYQALKTRRLVT